MKSIVRFIFSVNFVYILMIAAETGAIIFLCLFLPAVIPYALGLALFWLITLCAALVITAKNEPPEISRFIILLIIALPIAGAVIYLLSLPLNRKYGRISVRGGVCSGLGGVAAAYCGTGGVGYTRSLYFKNGTDYFDLLLKEIKNAHKSVFLEYFIVCKGRIFWELLAALNEAKANGAEIKIIIDGLGSAFKIRPRDIRALKAAGAEVKLFNRLKPLVYPRLNNRDHRKIVTVDGRVAFTGGFNLADEYANIDSPYGYWKDTGVALYGPAATVFESAFLSLWTGRRETDVPKTSNTLPLCVPYFDSPSLKTAACESLYLTAICSAKRRVLIFTPYFCPGEKLTESLKIARAKGVEVKIIIPKVPDKKYVLALSHVYARELTECGVEVYEFTPGFMHAKSVVCDDTLFIGSYNFDYRSMRLNYECGVAIAGETCKEAAADFYECLSLSRLITVKKRIVRDFLLKTLAPLF